MNTPSAKCTADRKFSFPTTPNLKRLGYGTGVGVFQVDRSPRNGLISSPWAIKKLMRMNTDSTEAQRLRNEAEFLKKLDHPNIVGFRAFSFTNDGRPCLAIEKCEISLGDLMEDQATIGPFSIVQIEKVAFCVGRALDYLHNEVHLLHGDIKSHNVLIKGDFEEIKLCDFGVSLPLKWDGSFDEERAAKDATYVGTRLWCAPEVYSDKTDELTITDKADIFPYGLTLWEMLTLSSPHIGSIGDEYFDSFSCGTDSFDEQGMEEILRELIGTRPALPQQIIEDDAYQKVIQLFTKCTETDYKIRFSAKDVLIFLNDESQIPVKD